jgi:hypothetical protein
MTGLQHIDNNHLKATANTRRLVMRPPCPLSARRPASRQAPMAHSRAVVPTGSITNGRGSSAGRVRSVQPVGVTSRSSSVRRLWT